MYEHVRYSCVWVCILPSTTPDSASLFRYVKTRFFVVYVYAPFISLSHDVLYIGSVDVFVYVYLLSILAQTHIHSY
ncbi:hypothetical protein EON63_09825 [archaeon]|nr:MAG: hypothetical protein EON63_09825 [archaeon]